LVLINRTVEQLDCDRVVSDNLAGGASVADFLVEHGRARAALITGLPASSTSRQRAAGFSRRMQQLGFPVADDMTAKGDFDYDIAFREVTRLLDAGSIHAIFCVNDLMAFAAQDAARARGLVP